MLTTLNPIQQGVCRTMALPLAFQKPSRGKKKKNYGNSNTSPCTNIIVKNKNPLKETKILQDIIITL
jgi:hypothetical protein